ncbi:hypothetical protein Aab01nite_37150 [Paractinoplanes abujensis]|uniref:DUF2786 domain-containing protein n=1 Tax=Paractinoplanes abujensis TaxID=882441 RepID=A0A7W7G586_9ACTN|nr:DUF2786 domain-containing protein [Actinoplanes abujensis]MBB4694661.1 hypothetical protein [Actinoplanes abujensis]GID20125.1 hypothetical protein Aab01nite_37150 [Actinoplanes abujensis]
MSVQEIVRDVAGGAIGYEAGLDALTVAPAAEVDAALGGSLRDAFERLFKGGWQPAELHRVIARLGDPVKAALVADGATAYGKRFADVDSRWQEQVARLPRLSRRPDRISVIDSSLGLLIELRRLPVIEVLIPPPGTAAATDKTDNKVLERVRALLAKAESTDFPAEAEAYSAKAQELIARHSIEEALTSADRADVVPFARRIGVDHPYESEKASLLDAVARANHCHTVWSPELGFSTVFGFDADIDGVELLYTSLLVQANRAMSRDEPAKGKARIKAFRRSFLVAYAIRIGERLVQVTRQELASHSDLLPVLRNRDIQVREAMQKAFPRTVRARGSRIDSLEGWESGRAAADEAELG